MDRKDEVSARAGWIVLHLTEAIVPREGEPFGHITPEEARTLVRDLLWIAAYVLRTRAH